MKTSRICTFVFSLLSTSPALAGNAPAPAVPGTDGVQHATQPPVDAAATPATSTGATTESTAADASAVSPEEAGRRFIRFIEQLKTADDLSLEKLQEAMGMTLSESMPGFWFFFQTLDDGWLYLLRHNTGKLPDTRTVIELRFTHKGSYRNIPAALCKTDFADYHYALLAKGYAFELNYDVFEGRRGRLLSILYTGKWPEIQIAPDTFDKDGELQATCMRSISIHTRT